MSESIPPGRSDETEHNVSETTPGKTAPAGPQRSPEKPGTRSPDAVPPLSWGTRFLHLFGLSALAISQPLLGRLAHNGVYLQVDHIGGVAVWMTLAILVIGLPLLLLLIVRLADSVNARMGRWAYAGFVFVMMTLMAQAWMKFSAPHLAKLNLGIPETLFALFAVVVGYVAIVQYQRRAAVRQFVNVMSWCTLAVPVVFAFSPQMRPVLFPRIGVSEKPAVRCDNPVPVVMIVFDGFSGMALLNERLELDSERYPGFGRLASMSTWYRNASTVHFRTDNAVPALLTGCFPPGGLDPVEADYPNNLFRMITDSQQYEMTVFEPYTMLCPREILAEKELPETPSQLSSILMTLGQVYVDTTMPEDIPALNDLIPMPWFGLPLVRDNDDSARTGLVRYGWDTERREQLRHFEKCLIRSDMPWFRYLHVVVPHIPWSYLPSQRESVTDQSVVDLPFGAHGDFGETWGPDELACNQSWQRYLLQVGFVDNALNRILDQLESQQMLDESLLVVVADHGVAFRKGMSRRDPTAETLPDIMPIPLFIKLPSQRTGRSTDRNVEIIDVFPTIADVLKITPEVATDGDSLLDETRPARLRKQLLGPQGPFIVEPDFPQRFDYVRRATALFGSGQSEALWNRTNTIPDLIGQDPASILVPGKGVSINLPIRFDRAARATESFVPSFIYGRVASNDTPTPIQLAIAVNGQIRATTRTYEDSVFRADWSALIPETSFVLGENDIQYYEVSRTENRFTLRLCPVQGE